MSFIAAERVIGYSFTQQDLLTEALDTTGQRKAESNQRLALLGDALLKMIILDEWYTTGNPKGMPTTRCQSTNSVADHKQGTVTIWSPQLATTAIWQQPPEKLVLTNMSLSTPDNGELCLTSCSQRPSRPSWAPSTSTRERTWITSAARWARLDSHLRFDDIWSTGKSTREGNPQ
jgi:hypothetical protein